MRSQSLTFDFRMYLLKYINFIILILHHDQKFIQILKLQHTISSQESANLLLVYKCQ